MGRPHCHVCGLNPKEAPTVLCAPCALSPPDTGIASEEGPHSAQGSRPESIVSPIAGSEDAIVSGAGHSNVARFSSYSSWSLKRLAWAFGCAKANSDEEIDLFRELKARMRR